MKPMRISFPVQILLHILFWAVLVGVPLFVRVSFPSFRKFEEAPLVFALLYNALLIVQFYLNAYVYIPRFLLRHRLPAYLIAISSSFIVCILFLVAINLLYENGTPLFVHTFIGIVSCFFILTLSYAYRTIYDRIREDRVRKEKETEQLRSELSFLRSQVSQHFIFNVLNGIVSLSRKKSDLVEPMLLNLSGLMRYMLYESDETKVPLERETQYLQSYISLQRMRFGDRVQVELDIYDTQPTALIEPMLLIPFIENAFKHGTGLIPSPYIRIQLQNDSAKLIFRVENSVSTVHESSKDVYSGIGLTNVRRRLELLYADRYQLTIQPTGDNYTVELIIRHQ